MLCLRGATSKPSAAGQQFWTGTDAQLAREHEAGSNACQRKVVECTAGTTRLTLDRRTCTGRRSPRTPGPRSWWTKRWTSEKAETKKASTCWPFRVLVRKGGFEPPRSCERQPLKLVDLLHQCKLTRI